MPHFSVIIPAHNAARTLGETLSSVCRQTFTDWEVLIIDDGSTDDTLVVAAAFAGIDDRFRVLRVANGGPARARNLAALTEATGTFLAFLDADDIWAEDKLETSAAALAMRPTLDGVFGQVSFFQATPADARTVSRVRLGVLKVADLLGENPVCTLSNLVVRRSCFQAIGGFNESLRHAEDLECLIRLAAAGGRIAAIRRVLVHYRTSPAGLSSDLEAMHAGWRKVAEAAQASGVRIDDADQRSAEAVHLRYLARRALRLRNPGQTALGFVLRGIRLSPAAFLLPLRRGVSTLLAALAAPVLQRLAGH